MRLLVWCLFVSLASAKLQCATRDGTSTKLPDEYLNDDYCDCLDGSDETSTSACSGFSKSFYKCRLDVEIPFSRLSDDICDCCDGADEPGLDCPDECTAIEEKLAAERQRLVDNYQKGSVVRNQQLHEFVTFVETTKQERAVEQEKLETLQSQLKASEDAFRTLKSHYSALYLKRHAALYQNKLLDGLTERELELLIAHVCQVQGELSDDSTTKTCVPLRLAGVDLGILWSDSYEILDDQGLRNDILYHNVRHDRSVWKLSDSKRRLTLVAAEDTHEGYEDYPYDDDYHYDDEEYGDRHRHRDQNDEPSGSEEDLPIGPKREELTTKIKNLPFSANRATFLNHAAELLTLIDEASKVNDEEGEDEGEKGSEAVADTGEQTEGQKEEPKEKDEPTMTFTSLDPEDLKREAQRKQLEGMDPMALPMVQSALEKRKNSIERGLDYAVSANVLLEKAPKTHLRELAVGTLYRSNVSALSLYQILTKIIPSLANSVGEDPRTCSGPFAESCPPQTLDRSGTSLPPSLIVADVEAFCANQTPTEGTCASSGDEPLIPTEVPDGYHGYYEPKARIDTDALSTLFTDFAEMDAEEAKVQEDTINSDKVIEKLRSEISRSEKQIKKLDEGLGSDDPNKYGPDGELHALKDECFEVPEGKYVYEMCLFGSAYQKEKGEGKGRGTNLGQWQGASTETVTDDKGREYEQRVWKWDKGTKCWNGPQRSATVYVSCGAETKPISADEPDTCRYVLELESPVACDEEFRIRNIL